MRKPVAAHEFLEALFEAEVSGRGTRRVRTALRLSNLPTGQTLANFDFAFQPAIERSRIETLATCAWVRNAETVLIQGTPGVGKTHLAIALGIKAVEQGFSVQYFRFDELLNEMRSELLASYEVLTTAFLDRLLHKAHALNIKGRSYRLRDLEQAASM